MIRLACIVLVVAMPAGARAQAGLPLHRLQIAAGVGFWSGAALGSGDAELRSGTSNERYRIFATSTRLAAAPFVELRATVDLTRRFGVEARALYGHPELRASVTADVENGPSIEAAERLDHYVIDGGVVIMLPEIAAARWQSFAAAGTGYLRQLHEGRTLTEEGRVFYVGGGVRRSLVTRPSGLIRGLGARGDVRLNFVSGGVSVEDRSRRHVTVGGGVFVVF